MYDSCTFNDSWCAFVISEMRIVEVEASPTLMLPRGDNLVLHCVGEIRSRPVWYHDGQRLDELYRVRTDAENNIREMTLRRLGNRFNLDGEYQCRDRNGLQADSDVLVVVYTAEA